MQAMAMWFSLHINVLFCANTATFLFQRDKNISSLPLLPISTDSDEAFEKQKGIFWNTLNEAKSCQHGFMGTEALAAGRTLSFPSLHHCSWMYSCLLDKHCGKFLLSKSNVFVVSSTC